jgi:hypothetical protein
MILLSPKYASHPTITLCTLLFEERVHNYSLFEKQNNGVELNASTLITFHYA